MDKKIKLTMTRSQMTVAAIWIGAGLLLAFGFFAVYLPQHQALVKTHRKYIESTEQAELAKKAASEQARLDLDLQTRQTTQQLNALTIPATRLDTLIFDIGRLANELKLVSFSSKSMSQRQAEPDPDKSKAKPLLSDAWLTLEFQGTYRQFADFVNRLERNSPVVFMERIFVTRPRQPQEQSHFKIELSVITAAETDTRSVAMKDDTEK